MLVRGEAREIASVEIRQQDVACGRSEALVTVVGRPTDVGREHDVVELRERMPRRQRLLVEHVQTGSGDPFLPQGRDECGFAR